MSNDDDFCEFFEDDQSLKGYKKEFEELVEKHKKWISDEGLKLINNYREADTDKVFRYHGFMKNKMFHGPGIRIKTKEGNQNVVYIGEWRDGIPNGYGRRIIGEEVCQGYFIND